MFWADVILFFAGLSLIALALILSRRLGNQPVQFGFTKLGLDIKADRLTFVLVIAVLLIGVGVFFRYQNYESQLKTLQAQVAGFGPLQNQYSQNLQSLRDDLHEFKVYDLGLKIVFPNVSGSDVENFFEIQILTQREPQPFAISNYKPTTNYGETYVNLNNLNRGEKVRIMAKDKRDDTMWVSTNDILIPETEIQMKKKTQ
jgi:hypothetical protein